MCALDLGDRTITILRRALPVMTTPQGSAGSTIDPASLAPGVKTGFIEFKSPHALWRGTRFGVTFETSIESAAAIDRFVFHTEKPMKPMVNLRPFVMLGSAGTMATLRALGFRGFHPTYASAGRAPNPFSRLVGSGPVK